MTTWELHVIVTNGTYMYTFDEKPRLEGFEHHHTWTGTNQGEKIEVRVGYNHVTCLREVNR